MKSANRKTLFNSPIVKSTVFIALAVMLAFKANAQPSPVDTEKMVAYAQCIRANGYADFPDPQPDGRLLIKVDKKNAPNFQAAQQACKDKAPSGFGGNDQAMTPERMQAMLGFAACMRSSGVNGFPDPSPTGAFELSSPTLDMFAPQVQKSVQSCRASNSSMGGLKILRMPPK